jgi:hypothetical protein
MFATYAYPVTVHVRDVPKEHGDTHFCWEHVSSAPGKVAGRPFVVGGVGLCDDSGHRVCPTCAVPAIFDGRARLADPAAVRALIQDNRVEAGNRLLRELLDVQANAGREQVAALHFALEAAVARGGADLDRIRDLIATLT